ncbi:unnamed protein product [Lepeophtheirus salmonis]|uniref:(salmon louse) hypothetical protein n=1 Tax=Lepeophtheirus salmonis TaxID=72036 RepID=A0A7R8CAX3_LEPSM|nr:unnamed protein product [Lepeophtheirus salmonis]CAF2752915.1 unnamed protein product [Lepeophtheirus salmonis]
MVKLGLLLFVATVVSGDIIQPNPFSSNSQSSFNQGFNGQPFRQGRQDNSLVSGAVDFSGCQNDPETGLCCVEKQRNHSEYSKGSYPRMYSQEQEVCEEKLEKICQVTFKQQATEETIKKCYKPLEKVCNGQGPEECHTKCEKLPIEICGAGCVTEEGPQECHDKTITSLIDVPEEVCDLNPQKTCRFQTKLVPKLKPKHECTTFPQEVCNLKFSQPQKVDKPLRTKWCLDPTPAAPGETYDEDNALGAPLG